MDHRPLPQSMTDSIDSPQPELGPRSWINPHVDRSKWTAGAWDGEPDKVQWTDPTTGLACLAKRHYRMGNWCGYVGVPESHPLHGKHYDELPEEVEVHGGITYASECEEGPPAETICHIPEPGTPEHLWWFGFDCGHAFDFMPGLPMHYPDNAYRDLPYVQHECALLAGQLSQAAS